MTEDQNKQYTKRAPAQYKRQEFYFRGGDVLREQEYLQEEFKKALSDYRIAQQHLRQLQEEVQDATEILAEREGYTNALANYLERDTQAATTEEQMKKRLSRLEMEIADVEAALRVVKSYHNPAALASLQKEKAHYMIEIQRGRRTIDSYSEQSNEATRQISACTVNGRYREARNLEYAARKTQNKKLYLRRLVQDLKKEFDTIKPITPLQDKDSRLYRSYLSNNIQNNIILLRTKECEKTHLDKHRKHILDLLDQISELNDRMDEIGIPNDKVNIDEFKERVLNEDYSDDEDEYQPNEEEEHHDTLLNDNESNHSNENDSAHHSEHDENGHSNANDEDENLNGEEEKGSEEEKHSTNNQTLSGGFEDDEKKSESHHGMSMSNDFEDDNDKAETNEESQSEKKEFSENDFEDDEKKKSESGANLDDDFDTFE